MDTNLFWHIYWLIVAVCGGLSDSLMWGEPGKDWKPLRAGWGHVPWLLGVWGFGILFLPVWITLFGQPELWRWMVIAFGASAAWDAVYNYLKANDVLASLENWLVIGKWRIGPRTRAGVLWFYVVRMVAYAAMLITE